MARKPRQPQAAPDITRSIRADPRRPRTRRERREDAAAAPEPDTSAPTATPPAAEGAGRSPSKLDALIALLRRPEGATLDQIVEATGWQRHSARGALAGAVKKKLGAAVVSEKVDGVRRYKAPEVAR